MGIADHNQQIPLHLLLLKNISIKIFHTVYEPELIINALHTQIVDNTACCSFFLASHPTLFSNYLIPPPKVSPTSLNQLYLQDKKDMLTYIKINMIR